MIGLGAAFQFRVEPYHRAVVISDASKNGGVVILVRITTDSGFWADRECILEPTDWPVLTHRSTVAYSTTKWGNVTPQLQEAVIRGTLSSIQSPPTLTLKRMIEAAKTADGFPPGAIQWLAQIP